MWSVWRLSWATSFTHVELIETVNKTVIITSSGYRDYLFQGCTVKQISKFTHIPLCGSISVCPYSHMDTSTCVDSMQICLKSGGVVDCIWNVMAHAQKPYFVFQRNGRVHLNWKGSQFSRLLAAEVCASAVVMLDTQSSEVVSMVLATHSIRQFPLHFYSRASPCAITFQLDSAYTDWSMTTPYRLWAAIKLCRWPPMTQRSQWIL